MANGVRGNIVRSRTGYCNREDRPSYQRRIYEARFGIHRPLSGETSKQLGKVITDVYEGAEAYLEERRSSHQRAHVAMRTELGVTYLQRMHCGDVLRKKQVDTSAGYRVQGQIIADKRLSQELAVPLAGLEWVGARQQKLALMIGGHAADDEVDIELQDAQLDRLAQDGPMLEAALENAATEALIGRIKIPDHATILHYSGSVDPHVASTHKDKIMDIAYEHIVENDIHTVTLGGMALRGFEPNA